MWFLVVLGLMGAWGCGGDRVRSTADGARAPDAGAEADAGVDGGAPVDPECGDTVELSGVVRQEPQEDWRDWDAEVRACLVELDIASHSSFDDLSFWRADSIEVEGEAAESALLCDRGAIVVHADTWLRGTLSRALVVAYVDEAHQPDALTCAERASGPNCGPGVELGDLAALEPPEDSHEWYEELLACLAGLDVEPRLAFDELSWWSSSELEYSAVCGAGVLVLPSAYPAEVNPEEAVRYAMAAANIDAPDLEPVVDACVSGLVSP